MAALREHGVTHVALGDFEAHIDRLPPPAPEPDEGSKIEQYDIDTLSAG